MEIASRNSMTFLSPVSSWRQITAFISNNKTQSKTLEEQYASGVRVFDIKISFDERTNHVVFRNKNVVYHTFSFFEHLQFLNKCEDCKVQLTLDMTSARNKEL